MARGSSRCPISLDIRPALYNRDTVTARNPLAGKTALAGLLAILLLGLSLRLWGISSGAPYRMGVDEPVVLATSVRMMKTGDFNPHFFDYGGLTFNFHAAVSTFSFLQRAMNGRWHSLDQTWFGDFLVPTRTATAVLGTLTILLVYLIGLRWGQTVALVSALVLAVLPAHVRESHFTLTDTPLTFLGTLTLLLSIRAVEARRFRAITLAGLAVGLTAAIKYNGLIVAVMPALAALAFPAAERLRALAFAALAAAAGFLAAAPYTVLDLPAFLNGFAALMQSYNRAHSTTWSATLIYLGHLRNWFGWPGVVPLAVGYVGLLVATYGLFESYWRRASSTAPLAALMPLVFGVVYFLFIASQGSLVYGRYLMPLAPIFALGMGVGLTWLATLIVRRVPAAAAVALPLLFAVVVGPPAAAAVAWDARFAKPVTLDQAARWVANRTTQGDVIVFEGAAFVVPPRVTLRPTNRVIDKPFDTYRAEGVNYLVASSDIADTYAKDPAATEAHRALFGRAEIVQTFPPTPQRGGPTITILRISE
jgi:4-amino-4-deoxy-L-arabinose transferase-like glycosyltransferase